MGAADVKGGVLRRVLPERTLPLVAVSILTPGRVMPAKARVFSELLAQQFGQLP